MHSHYWYVCASQVSLSVAGIPLFRAIVDLFEDAKPILDGVLANNQQVGTIHTITAAVVHLYLVSASVCYYKSCVLCMLWYTTNRNNQHPSHLCC